MRYVALAFNAGDSLLHVIPRGLVWICECVYVCVCERLCLFWLRHPNGANGWSKLALRFDPRHYALSMRIWQRGVELCTISDMVGQIVFR